MHPDLISEDQVQEALEASPAERVTVESMQARISYTSFMRLPNSTVTICNITLDNGFSVRGESACVNPANYNQSVGEKIAYDDAFNKPWPLFGFLLAEKNHTSH